MDRAHRTKTQNQGNYPYLMKKILLVDDETGLTALMKLNLEATGLYEVLVENQSVLATNAAKSFKPDLIILDYIMPEKDGGDLMIEFQADPELKNLPVIMLTALVSDQDTHGTGLLESGGQTMLPKPVSLDVLLRCIEEELSNA